ncbi:MAG: hypothetical protein WDO68_06370 [Gammaproteobacteria bacterium]
MTPHANDLRKTCFRVLIAASALLVLTTLIFRFRTHYFLWLAPLNLTEENVAAAWFSGTLLLLASLLAADGYFRLRSIHFKAALAWWVIAGMLMALSLDEIACLHERIEEWKTGPIVSFIPFLVVLLAGCAWSFVQLWLTPSERPKVKGLVLGFGLLVSIGGQEIMERIVTLPWYLAPFRSALEEGSELAAMLILVYTTLPNSFGLFENTRPAGGPAFSGVAALRWPILILATLIAWPLAALTASMAEQAALGHFSDWMSCALFFFAAAFVVRHWASATTREPFPTSAVVLLCAASAMCVQFDPIGDRNIFPGSSTIDWFGLRLNTRLVLLALCCLGAGESLRSRGAGYRSGAASLATVGGVSAIFSAYSTPDTLWWGYFATTVIAIGTFATVALALRSPATIAAVQRTPA